MKTVVVINRTTMGTGDDVLGARILQTFLGKAGAALRTLDAILFYNSGVKVLSDGSPCLPALAALEQNGIELIACGTCVDHFELRDRIRVGVIAGMDDLLRSMDAAERVITL
ncbi:MAG TPA: DsrE family protein [Phycisphaerae bacterium]|nr:DsrE family protein [Phycisphaerae bacterium]